MVDVLILDKSTVPFRSCPVIHLLPGDALDHRGNNQCLLRQNTVDCQWHYPPQAFFRQQFSHGREKLVQRSIQFFNRHLGEDVCKRKLLHCPASWVRFCVATNYSHSWQSFCLILTHMGDYHRNPGGNPTLLFFTHLKSPFCVVWSKDTLQIWRNCGDDVEKDGDAPAKTPPARVACPGLD